MATYMQLCIALLAFYFARLSDAAIKWNLTNNVVMAPSELQSSLIDIDPYDIPANCSILGVCVPFTVNLNATTAWAWCGWSSTQRTDYIVSNSKGFTSAELMRQDTFQSCFLPKGAKGSKCEYIFGSQTDTKVNYTQRVLGLAFSDVVCLIIANNGQKAITFDVQVFQRKDWPRYNGTIFSIILTILLLGGVTAYLAYSCYREITSPPDRIGELSTFTEQLNRSNTEKNVQGIQEVDDDEDDEVSDPGTFKGRIKVALTKVKGLVVKSKPAQA